MAAPRVITWWREEGRGSHFATLRGTAQKGEARHASIDRLEKTPSTSGMTGSEGESARLNHVNHVLTGAFTPEGISSGVPRKASRCSPGDARVSSDDSDPLRNEKTIYRWEMGRVPRSRGGKK